jgi:hypothetical protein
MEIWDSKRVGLKVNNLEKLISCQDFHESKPALVIGSAPSIKLIKKFKFNGIRIGIGDMPWRAPELGLYDYWVTANSEFPKPWVDRHFKILRDSRAHVLISSVSVADESLKFEDIAPELSVKLNVDWITVFDQRHFGFGHALTENLNCCKFSNFYGVSPAIQELLSKKSLNFNTYYSEGGTVALHGYALAVLLKCNPIFIAGVDLPILARDYKAYKNYKRLGESFKNKIRRLINEFHLEADAVSAFGNENNLQILEDFKIIESIASEFGIKTYVLSPKSELNKLAGFDFFDIKKPKKFER